MNKKLTPKQKLFVKHYLIDFNATSAAISAGYSKKTAYSIGEENLRKPEIAKALQGEVEKKFQQLDLSAEMILKELLNISMLDMADYVTVGENGEIRAVPFDHLPAGSTKYINKIKYTQKEGAIEYQHPDKLRALELLGKYFKLFTEKKELSGVDGGPLTVRVIYDEPKTPEAEKESPA